MKERTAVAKAVRQALGTHEAAGLMGVHYSRVTRMFDEGLIAGREMRGTGKQRRYILFDGMECETNFRAYEDKVLSRGGTNDRRPRAYMHMRAPVLEFLSTVATPIEFGDAIGVREAAELLNVHDSMVPRLASSGAIVGRVTMGRDGPAGSSRAWMLSRRSCVANAKKVRAQEAGGRKVGRRRKR